MSALRDAPQKAIEFTGDPVLGEISEEELVQGVDAMICPGAG